MRLKLGLIGAVFAVGAVTAAFAADDVIAARQDLMKKNGAAAKIAVSMLKGETPYDAAAAASAATTIADDMMVFPTLFPAGSETGDTKAGPAIWTDPDGFKAAADAAVTAAKAAAEAAAAGPEAFGAAFQAVGAACGACHQKYRS